jgi:hypothetical protein
MKVSRAFFLAVAVAVAAAGCDTADPTTTTTAPSTIVQPTVENFTGTVAVGGSDFKPFPVLLSGGTLTVTLTAAGPPSSITMVLGVGTVNGSSCVLLSGGSLVTQAATTPQLSGQVNAGAYCVQVADTGTGTQTGPVTYAVTVTHY